MGKKFTVQKGQRYAEFWRLRSNPRLWEVDSVVEHAARIPHARLVNVRDRQHFKTISCHTLINNKSIRLVEETLAPRAL